MIERILITLAVIGELLRMTVLLISSVALVFLGMLLVESLDNDPYIAIPVAEKMMEKAGWKIEREQIHHVPYT